MLDPRLNHVVAVAHGGSFTKAAEIVGVTQSGITKSIADLENEFEGKGYGDFKSAVAEVVVEYLRPIRAKALELLEDEKHLIDLLHNGAEKARVVASATLSDTYKNLGLVK